MNVIDDSNIGDTAKVMTLNETVIVHVIFCFQI